MRVVSSRILSPEQQRAINILQNAKLTKPLQHMPKLLEILKHNSQTHINSNRSTKDLPKGEYWIWNQSRRRETLTTHEGDYTISFFKLSAKVKPKFSCVNPGYKLWVFNLTHTSSGDKSTFLWCEKGTHGEDFPEAIETSVQFSYPDADVKPPNNKKPWEIEIPNDGTYFKPFSSFQICQHQLPSINTFYQQ